MVSDKDEQNDSADKIEIRPDPVKRKKLLPVTIGISILLGVWLATTSKNPTIADLNRPKMTEESLKSPRFSTHKVSEDQSTPTPNESNATTSSEESEMSPKERAEIEELRSLAKSNLAAAFTAQKAFFAEWNRYSTDLRAIGFEPYSKRDINFKLGFLEPFYPPIEPDEVTGGLKEKPEQMTSDIFIGQEIVGFYTDSNSPKIKFKYEAETKKIKLNDYTRFCEKGCRATNDSFEMLIAFPIPFINKIEVWTIDHEKNMKQQIDGLEN